MATPTPGRDRVGHAEGGDTGDHGVVDEVVIAAGPTGRSAEDLADLVQPAAGSTASATEDLADPLDVLVADEDHAVAVHEPRVAVPRRAGCGWVDADPR